MVRFHDHFFASSYKTPDIITKMSRLSHHVHRQTQAEFEPVETDQYLTSDHLPVPLEEESI